MKKSSKGSFGTWIFGGIFFLLGSAFAVLGFAIAWKELSFQFWEKEPCVVESFEIQANPHEDPRFIAEISFSYRHQGNRHIGTRLFHDGNDSDEHEDLAEIRAHCLNEPNQQCFIDPENPSEAVLMRKKGGFLGPLIIIPVGLIFASIGLAVIFANRKKESKKARSKLGLEDKENKGGLALLIFCSVFALVGLGLLLGWSIPTYRKSQAVKNWVATPAEVVWSQVRTHTGDDSTTYSVDIFYRYRVDNIDYHSNTWDLIGGSSSGRAAKQEIVSAHPPGSTITCYVDPEAPWRAVVQRDAGAKTLLLLLPLPFLAFGLLGMRASTKRKSKSGSQKTQQERPQKSSMRKNRFNRFLGILIFAICWNAFVGLFIWLTLDEVKDEWFLIIFLGIFVLIGVGLLLAALHQFIALFSPSYEIDLPETSLTPGSRHTLTWKQIGGSGQPNDFRLWFVGVEEASYQRGTSTHRDSSVFHEELLYQTSSWTSMASGTCDLIIPASAVPTFIGKHNKITWHLRLEAPVSMRPDVREEISLTVSHS